jgi:hypothetical protein
MSQQINLFNPAFVKQHKHFSLLAMLQGLGLLVAGSLVFYGYALQQVEQLGKQSEESTKRFNAEQVRLARYAAEFSPQQANQALQDEVRRLEKQLADQAELIELMKSGAVGNTTGYSEYMRAFSRQVVQGLWLTGFRVSGDAAQISLNGAVLAPELLPAYIQRLSQENIMRGRTFSTLQMRQPKVVASPVGNATQGGGASQGAIPRYVEFTLHSSADGEVKK